MNRQTLPRKLKRMSSFQPDLGIATAMSFSTILKMRGSHQSLSTRREKKQKTQHLSAFRQQIRKRQQKLFLWLREVNMVLGIQMSKIKWGCSLWLYRAHTIACRQSSWSSIISELLKSKARRRSNTFRIKKWTRSASFWFRLRKGREIKSRSGRNLTKWTPKRKNLALSTCGKK